MSKAQITIYAVNTNEIISSHVQALIRRTVNYVLEIEKKRNCSVSIVFLSETAMRQYNCIYRKKNYVPDILSFPGDDDTYLGDMLLCKAIIKKHAAQFNISEPEELLRVVIHGMLHMLGYTHKSYDPEEDMLIYQENLLHKILEKEKCVNL